MEISYHHNRQIPNFGSIKLADLNLRKTLLDNSSSKVQAELHELELSDLPLIKQLSQKYANLDSVTDTLISTICDNFENNLLAPLSEIRFFIVKVQNKIQAICKSSFNPTEIYLDEIVNVSPENDIKGAGTSLIVNLVELAKKNKKDNVTLFSLVDAELFYKKLGFIHPANRSDGTYIMPSSNFDNFLNKFKSKYFK